MIHQTTFTLHPHSRGFHLVTDEILCNLPPLPKVGLLNLFIQHTSAGLTINENADPDVQTDMGAICQLTQNRQLRVRASRYLCEFRNRGGGRNIAATIIGE